MLTYLKQISLIQIYRANLSNVTLSDAALYSVFITNANLREAIILIIVF